MIPSTRQTKIQVIFTTLLAIAGTLLVLLATRQYGPGVSSDSAFYLSSAENFALGKGFTNFEGSPLVDWPPLYPFILALIYRATGISLLDAGRLLNALFFGLTIISSAIFFRRCFPDRDLWFYLGTLATFLFLPLYTTAANISTDLIFLCLQVIFFLVASKFIENKMASSLFWLSLISASLAMLRYVGWLMILAEILLIFIVYRSLLKKAIIYSVIFGGLVALPFLVWVVGRNYLVYHTFFGARDTGLVSVLENIVVTFAKVNRWLFPLSLTQRLPSLWIWIGLLVLLLLFNRKNDWVRWGKKWVTELILPLTIFSFLYWLFIILTIYTGDHLVTDTYDDRLQAPLFFAVLVGIFITLDELVLHHIPVSRKKLADGIITILFVAWALYPLNLIYKFIHYSLQDGVVAYNNYNTRALNKSGLVEFLKSFDIDDTLKIYTNYGEAVYLYTGLHTQPSPRDTQSYTADPEHLLSQLKNWPPEPQAVLIWFRSSEKRNFFSPRDLSQISSMELLYDGSGGQVYLVAPK